MSETQTSGDGGVAAMSGRDRRDGLFLSLLAVMLVVLALVNSLSVTDEWRHRGRSLAFVEPLIWETSSIIVLMAMAPVIMALIRRVWPLAPPWWRTALIYIPVGIAYSLTHVIGMGVLRAAAYALAGAHYDAFAPLRDFIYEFRKDALVFAGFVSLYVIWLLWRAPRAAAPTVDPAAIEVRDGARRHFVPLAEVAFIEAAGNYVELHRGRTPILHRAPLSEMERQLQGQGFVRIHRSRLVQRAQVAEVESKPSGDYVVRLADGRELAGSRRYRRPLLEP